MALAEQPLLRRVVDVDDAPDRLSELGLTVDMLLHSIEVGDSKRRLVSQPVFPATYRGVAMWAETLAELRRQLLRLHDGWDIGSTGNYETVFSKERGTAIAVAAGDGGVGKKIGRAPRLTRRKGVKTSERVRRNALEYYVQDTLFLTLSETTKLSPDEACQTWFLLVHATKKEVRLELSCPISIDDDEIVSGWRERILLPSLSIAGAVAPISPDDDDDDDDDRDDDLVGR